MERWLFKSSGLPVDSRNPYFWDKHVAGHQQMETLAGPQRSESNMLINYNFSTSAILSLLIGTLKQDYYWVVQLIEESLFGKKTQRLKSTCHNYARSKNSRQIQMHVGIIEVISLLSVLPQVWFLLEVMTLRMVSGLRDLWLMNLNHFMMVL